MSCGEHSRRRGFGDRTRAARLVSAALVWFAAAHAAAQEQALTRAQTPVQERAAEPPPPVACSGRPSTLLPNQARCLERAPDDGDSAWLYVPRLVLAPVRLVLRTTAEVLLAGVRVEDEYELRTRARDLFFTENLEFGVYPVVLYATGFGLNAGLHLVHRNLFGHGEGLRVRAGFGGPHKQLYDARVHSGRLWPHVRLAAEAGYLSHDSIKFYGIGNGDRTSAGSLDLPLDALQEGPAVRTRYRQEEVRGGLSAQLAVARDLWFRLENEWRRVSSSSESSDSGTPWITEVYEPETLVGFSPDVTNTYTELALTYDTHRTTRADVPSDLPSRGIRLTTWGAMQTAPTQPHLTSGRAGIDVLPAIDLYRGDRVLRLRLYAETALAPLDAIEFYDLPSLGGAVLLRGYERGRFRGRLALLSSVEYRYPVQEGFAAYLFTDAGRVYTSWSELSLSSLRDTRVGFGGGLQVYAQNGALFLLQLASSIDGGLFVDLRFNTTLEAVERR
jgi:hypothetical protein